MKIALVTDSGSCINLKYANDMGIYVVPLSVIIDGTSYQDMVELTEAEFYEQIADGKTPGTSQPPVGEFANLYTKLKNTGYDAAIAVHISSKLSGTLNASQVAAEMVDFPVYTIDSGLVAKPMQFVIDEGIRLLRENKTVQDIIDGMKSVIDKAVGYIMLNDLNFLHKGGRLSASSALIGTLLRIKPILVVQNQTLELFEKVRTTHRAKEFLYNLLAKDVEHKDVKEIHVVHANYIEEAKVWIEELREKFSHIPIGMSTLGTVIGVHSGPGAIALTWRT